MVTPDSSRRRQLIQHREVTGIPIDNCTSNTRLLRVRPIEARGLRKTDIFGTSDPYCQISLYKNNRSTTCVCPTVQTKTIKRNLNPVWNEEFVFRVNTENRLVFQLFDHNRLTRDDFLGVVTVSLLHLDIGTEGDGQRRVARSFMLHPRSTRSQVKGSLYVYLIYLPIGTNVRIQSITELPLTNCRVPTQPASAAASSSFDAGNALSSAPSADSPHGSTTLVELAGGATSPTEGSSASQTSSRPSSADRGGPRLDPATRQRLLNGRSQSPLVNRDSCSSLMGMVVVEDTSSDLAPVDNAPLPQGWDERVDQNGRTYYVDHVNRRTQWDRPSCPLPEGWEQRTDPNGRVYYVDHVHRMTTWNHPLADPADVRPTPSPPLTSPLQSSSDQVAETDGDVPQGASTASTSAAVGVQRARSFSPVIEGERGGGGGQSGSSAVALAGSSTVPRHVTDPELAAREMFMSRRQVSLEDTVGSGGQRLQFTQAPGSPRNTVSQRSRTNSTNLNRLSPTPSTSRGRPERPRTNSESAATGRPNVPTISSGVTRSGVVVVDDSKDPGEAPLPPGWQIAIHTDGRKFFINHNDQTTTWDDPRTERSVTTESAGETNTTLLQDASQFELRKLGPLPAGWEERVHTDGRLFYINHNERTTQWDDPRLAQFSRAAVPYNRDFPQKCVFFYSHLRKPKDPQAKLEIPVRRNHVLTDAYRIISQIKKTEVLMHRLWIEFAGEKGLDYGGVRREFFYCLSREIFNPYYGLFEYSAADSYTLQINPSSGLANEDHLKYFCFCGIIMSMALYNKCLIDAYFIQPFYKMMLGRPIRLQDMESVDQHLHNSLKYILEADLADSTDYTFSATEERFGEVVEVDLIPNGRNIHVNNQNKKRFVECFIQWRYTDRVKPQMDALASGFSRLIDLDNLKVFDVPELELLLCGIQDLDVQDWKANTQYKGGYHANHPVIHDFWTTVFTLPREMQTRLLQFVTGTSRVPVQGFAHLYGSNGPQKFTIECWGEVDRFPRAHTCFNRLDLPPYKTLKDLKCKLIVAIEQSEGFDGVD